MQVKESQSSRQSPRFAQDALRVPARPADVAIIVEILPEAQRMVDEADERWTTEHGFDSDNPLLSEIRHASDVLRDNPQIGVAFRRSRFRSEVRRLLLRSGWHIYYTFDVNRSVVSIVAVWFANRGTTPPIA
jgi:hypothetical protein